MAQTAVAVVTGSNKGIGFAIVRGLCKQFKGDVYLTARDETRGKEAVAKLEAEGLHPKFHQLAIDDKDSIERLRKFLSEKYGGLDILVNNAAIAYSMDAPEPFSEQAEETIRINYLSLLDVCHALFPLLRSHARVVNVSSLASTMTLEKCSEALRQELKALNSPEDITRYMKKFVTATAAGNFQEQGWPQSAYGVSKIGVTLVTPFMQRAIDGDQSRSDIIINACCPGYVDTDMSSHKGTKTIDEGADTPLYLATLPPNTKEPRGVFISERKLKPVW